MEQEYNYNEVRRAYVDELPELNKMLEPYGLNVYEGSVHFSYGDKYVQMTVSDKICAFGSYTLYNLPPEPMSAKQLFEHEQIVRAVKEYNENVAYVDKFQKETGITLLNKPSATMYSQNTYNTLWYDTRAAGLIKVSMTMADLAKYLDQLKDRDEFTTYKSYILTIIRKWCGDPNTGILPTPTTQILVAPFDKYVERCYNSKMEKKYNQLALDLIQEAIGPRKNKDKNSKKD